MALKATYLIFHVIIALLGWACLGLGIGSVCSVRWMVVYGRHNRRLHGGLFEICTEERNCYDITDASDGTWLQVVQALVIAMLPVVVVAVILNHVAAWKYSKRLEQISVAIFLLAGILGVGGTSVYVAKTGEFYQQYGEALEYSDGFIMAWVAPTLAWIGGVFALVSSICIFKETIE